MEPAEIAKDAKEFVYERLKNPFLISLTFFWVVWNWQLVAYLLFSSDDIESKFNNYCLYVDYLKLYAYPIGAALVYSVVSSFVFAGIDWLASEGYHFRQKIYYNKSVRDLNGQERVEFAKANLEEAKTKYKAREELTQQIKRLGDDIKNVNLKYVEGQTTVSMFKQNVDSLFQFYLGDSDVMEFVKSTPDSQVVDLSKLLYDVVNNLDILNNKESINVINGFIDFKLIQPMVGEKMYGSNIVLTNIGYYLIVRYVFSNSGFKDRNILFNVNSKFSPIKATSPIITNIGSDK